MRNEEFEKLWNSGTDALYNAQETAKILKSFNDVINGLYSIGSEEEHIFNTLNVSTTVIKEYKKLIKSMGIDLIDIASTFEIMRSLLFGECLNWDNICNYIRQFVPSKTEAVG